MKRILLRISAILFLLVAVAHLTSVASIAAELASKTTDSCCDTPLKKQENSTVPCSVADCSCISCIAVDLIALPAVPSAPPEITTPYLPDESRFTSNFVKPIDYPPEYQA